MLELNIRSVGKYLDINGALYDVKDVLTLLKEINNIQYELITYLEKENK